MIKNLGLVGGLALGGSLIMGGFLMIWAGSPDEGGGIMIVLGMLFLVVPGVFIVGATLLAWITTALYGSLGSNGKRMVFWGFFALVVAWITAPFALNYFRFMAIMHSDESGMSDGGQKSLGEIVRQNQLVPFREHQRQCERLIIGTWRSETDPSKMLVFNNAHETYSTDGEKNHLRGSWNVHLNDGDPPTLQVIRIIDGDRIVDTLLQVNAAQLVIESLSGPGDASYKPGTAIHRYSRIVDRSEPVK